MSDQMNKDQESDGVGRRSFLKCMAWAGTGLVWAMNAGVLTSCTLRPGARRKGKFSFVQISDSHIGFSKEPNQDVTRTFQEAVSRMWLIEAPHVNQGRVLGGYDRTEALRVILGIGLGSPT